MKVKNFANFTLYCGDKQLEYGDMEFLMRRAALYATLNAGRSYDICFVAFDGDIDDESTKTIKGDVILSYCQAVEGSVMITSGK